MDQIEQTAEISGEIPMGEVEGFSEMLKNVKKLLETGDKPKPKWCPFQDHIGCVCGSVSKLVSEHDGILVGSYHLQCAAWEEEDGGYCRRIFPYGKPREIISGPGVQHVATKGPGIDEIAQENMER